ncbi:hypothetical protein D3C72_686540 [compost metagenome]
MWHHPRDDDGQPHHVEQHHARQAGGKARQEADQYRIGGVGEDDGAVERRFGVGHQLVGNPLEGRHYLGDDHAHTLQDDVDTGGEGDGLHQGEHEPVLALGDAGDELRPGEGGGDEEDDTHGEGDGHRGVAQEQQALGHLHLFAAVGLVAELGADPAGQHVGDGREVAERHVVGTGDLLHVRMGQGREQHHGHADHQAAYRDQRDTAHAAGGENGRHHHRHEEGVVTGQEDEFPRREAGDQYVHQHGEEHDHRHLLAERLLGDGDDGLVVGDHPLDAEGVLEDGGKIAEGVHHQGGTGPQDDEAHDGLDRALDALGHGFLLCYQADEGDQADQHGGLRQHVKHQKIEKFHGQLQADGSGGPQAAQTVISRLECAQFTQGDGELLFHGSLVDHIVQGH